MTLEQQADRMAYLIHRCTAGVRKGEQFADALLTLTAADVKELEHIERRLRLMAPHENDIRNIVARRR